MKRVLMITYAFPPMPYAGVYRTLRFCKYLPKFNWQPIILTINDYPYHKKEYTLMPQILDVKIYRTSTIDPVKWHIYRSSRYKAENSNLKNGSEKYNVEDRKKMPQRQHNLIKKIKGLLFSLASFPDHAIFWIPFATIWGLKIIIKEKPNVVYTSSPPHSSQLIGLILKKLSNKNWIADFRDPWVDNVYFEQRPKFNTYIKIISLLEKLVMKNATCVLLNTDFNRNKVTKRYPYLNQRKFETLTNGFDCDDIRGTVVKDLNKFTITFIGTFYSYFKTDLFLEGVKLWVEGIEIKNLSDKFQVLFIGERNVEVERKEAIRYC